MPKEVIFDKIQETIDLGGTGILMQGGLHPDLKIEWYEDLLRSHQAALRYLVPLLLRAGDRQHRRSQRLDACATRSPACATPASIPSPAAAPRFWTTTCATASAA